MVSAAAWVTELEQMQAPQAAWEAWSGWSCGLLVALVCGCITILEYPQNAFLGALIRSFGVSGSLVLLRYLAESLFLAAAASAATGTIASQAIPILAPDLDLSPAAIDALRAHLLNPREAWKALRFLLGGAVLAVPPVDRVPG